MYAAHPGLLVGLGLVALPISVVITLLQAGVVGLSSILGVQNEGGSASIFVLLFLAVGITLTLLGFGLIQAATVDALVAIDRGERIGPVHAYGLVLRRIRPLAGATLVGVVVVSLLSSTLVLIPLAIWFAVAWSLIAPVIAVERTAARPALGRSRRLVRGGWLKVGTLTIVAAGITLIVGPLIGTLLIVFTSLPLAVLNVIAGLVYAVMMPLVGLTTAYVYFDARVRAEQRPPPGPGELPAEITL